MQSIINKKKILHLNKKASEKMSKDKNLQTNARRVLVEADKKYDGFINSHGLVNLV